MLFLILIFIFGLAVGSFLNVVIWRLPRREPMVILRGLPQGSARWRTAGWRIVKSRSRCPCCRKILRWFELIPLFSFIIQKGRCRRCFESISWQYPLVEFFTGLVFLAVFWRIFFLAAGESVFAVPFGWESLWFSAVLWWFYASVLIVIFVYDLKYYLIPDRILFPAIGVAFFSNLFLDAAPRFLTFSLIELGSRFAYQTGPRSDFFLSGATAAFLFALFFFILFFVSRGRWLGFGDVKLAVFLGLILGFPAVIWGAFWAFFLGSLAGVALIILGKKGFKSEVPFGPFLCLGTFLTFLFGFKFFEWYNNIPFTIIDYF
ncbi:MAG: prepilin peptidase [bacterium]|nr:prepilin peptidase [bacterium]